METEQEEIPEYVSSLEKLAAILGWPTGRVRDLAARDRRFPAKIRGRGYSVYGAATLLEVRRLEALTDDEYLAEHQTRARDLLARIDRGELAEIPPDGVARLRALLLGDLQLTDGKAARAEAIHEELDALDRFAGRATVEKQT